ncbi:MAG: prepilin peptidase [Candidatus Saccharimonadales bacterium]
MNDNLLVVIAFCVFGFVMGSFVGATVWRLRARQLREDIKTGEKIAGKDKKQVIHIKNMHFTEDRSVCLHCGHRLVWYDLIPVISWIGLGGKCRYCHKKIGIVEPLLEIGMAIFFVVSYIFWPLPLLSSYDIVRFVLWLVSGIGVAILAVYDVKWFLLPNRIVYPLIGIGIVNTLVVLAQNNFTLSTIYSIVYACIILSGLYLMLYIVSSHKWVGFGDVKLGFFLALMLANWKLALLTLFLANAIGTLIVVPLLILGKLDRGAHIPFGPLLIAGWMISSIFGERIINLYLSIVLGVA